MAAWATQRKTTYASLVIIVLLICIALPVFLTTYHKPSCADGILNGGEEGIDCGGVCPRLCQSAFLAPLVSWAKTEKVADGLYNVAAYIINPNVNGAAVNVPYVFSLFDKEGELIVATKGATTLPAHRNTLAFVPAVDTGKRIPAKAVFEFAATPLWQKSHDTIGDLAIIDKKYAEDETSSSLDVTLQNRALYPYANVYVFAILYDADNNAVGFSRTRVDSLAPGASDTAPFTWPVGRSGRVASIEILPLTVPVIDAK
ncbi:MAG: hypothetical protein JWO73_440 [Candidatus Taylorbacteria bacterium]|nr:hypothetical protein [Candidatus Taylorbacteria bacterium]